MLAFIQGAVELITEKTVIINVHGVGYEINIPSNIVDQLPPVGSQLKLFTYFHVREDQIQLFGFLQASDKELFKILLNVSGIGPKLAMEILSNCPKEDFISAILVEDLAYLTKIPGIGKKTAQRLILELKDKFKKLGIEECSVKQITDLNQSYQDTIEALVALGYRQSEVVKVLEKIEDAANTSTDILIRTALKELGRE